MVVPSAAAVADGDPRRGRDRRRPRPRESSVADADDAADAERGRAPRSAPSRGGGGGGRPPPSGGDGRRRMRGGGRDAAGGDGDDGFGEFPPPPPSAFRSGGGGYAGGGGETSTTTMSTPQISNRSSDVRTRIRFSEDALMMKTPGPAAGNREVLALGGDSGGVGGGGGSDRRRRRPAPQASPDDRGDRDFRSPDEATPSLDFSMITTPGGKLARMVDGDGGFLSPEAPASSSGGSRWGASPLGSILRGVVSSTPTVGSAATPYAAAREALNGYGGSGSGNGNGNPNHNKRNNYHHQNDDPSRDPSRTALSFSRSSSHSGYLRKLGRNIPAFKRRFFVLRPSTHLYYFVGPDDVEPRGCIDLDSRWDRAGDDGEGGVEGGGAGGGGGCEVREVGTMPDGTFRFELTFREEANVADGGSLADDDDASDSGSRSSSGSSRRRQRFRRRTVVLEARTESIGREWMAKLRSERLSAARSEADRLLTDLDEMRSISARWEDSACEEAMRADAAERARDVAIADARTWEGRFAELDEAIGLLAKEGGGGGGEEGRRGTTYRLPEGADGLPRLDGTHFDALAEALRAARAGRDDASKKESEASDRVAELERRVREVEDRAQRAEDEASSAREEGRALREDLTRARREKKILVKEVKALRAAAAEEEEDSRRREPPRDDRSWRRHDSGSVQSSRAESRSDGRGGASHSGSNAPAARPPRRKLDGEERRLVLELEEHVMSGLRLSEQFLTLNGIDPSEAGDDLDGSVQASVRASKAGADASPERRAGAVPFREALLDLSPMPTRKAASRPLPHYGNRPLGSLMDDNDDESESALVSADAGSSLPEAANSDRNGDNNSGADGSFVAESMLGADLLDNVHQYQEASSSDDPVNQNLHDKFAGQMLVTPGQSVSSGSNMGVKQASHTGDRSHAPPSRDAASRVTDNGRATTKLECPLRDVGETPHHHNRPESTLGDDGKVYHIAFRGAKIGLQFQKVPNDPASGGLLTDAMTADHGHNVEAQTAADLRRVASFSRRPRDRDRGDGRATECLPATPADAVLVCGFVGFDDSTGNVRPRIGARLVAFDGIPVEVGHWTFESIRKSIQARGRPLTLSFRNDFLTPKQRAILTKAVDDVNPNPTSSSQRSDVFRGIAPTRETNHDHIRHDNAIYTSTSSLSSHRSLPKSKYGYAFSEAGSSITSAVAPLVSNLLSNRSAGVAPDYLKRTSDSLDKMRHHHDFQSGLL
ncbi:hypothetical protein ACHAWF_012305 [Thalassiosira exigua]